MSTVKWFLRGLFANRYSIPDLVVFAYLVTEAPFWIGLGLWVCWVFAVMVVRDIIAYRKRAGSHPS